MVINDCACARAVISRARMAEPNQSHSLRRHNHRSSTSTYSRSGSNASRIRDETSFGEGTVQMWLAKLYSFPMIITRPHYWLVHAATLLIIELALSHSWMPLPVLVQSLGCHNIYYGLVQLWCTVQCQHIFNSYMFRSFWELVSCGLYWNSKRGKNVIFRCIRMMYWKDN